MKKINLLIALAFCTSSLFAQFATNWSADLQATPSLNYSNEGRKIVTDANSNVFVLGDYSSDKDSSGHASASTLYSVRIHKYNFTGSLLTWAYIPVGGLINNGYDNRSGFGLELDASGNVYVGYSVLNAAGNFDVVMAKYSNSLIKQWELTYATANNDIGVDFKLNGSVPNAIVKSYGGGNATYSIVKAQVGSISATLLYSFVTNVDVVNALALTSKYIYVTGYSLISGAKSALTASVGSGGSLKWKANYNHGSVTGDDYGNKLMLGIDGLLYVIGTTYTNAANGNDGLLMRYNSSGFQLGVLILNKNTSDVGYEIASGPSGYVYAACGNTNSMSVYKVQLSPLSVNLSASNSPTPSSAFTGITNTVVTVMKVAPSGNVYLCGYVDATSASGNFSASVLSKFGLNGFLFKMLNTQSVVGSFADNYRSVSMVLDGYKNDILVLRNYFGNNTNHSYEAISIEDYDGGTSLRLANENTSSTNLSVAVSLFPNPATDKISVRAEEEITSIEICDITGKIARNIKADATEVEIITSDLNQGLYICKTTTVSGAVSMKRLMIN